MSLTDGLRWKKSVNAVMGVINSTCQWYCSDREVRRRLEMSLFPNNQTTKGN